MEKTNETVQDQVEADRETADGDTILRVRIPRPLIHQLEDLAREPAFEFRDLEHVVQSALWSFANYKMRQLRILREDARGVR